MSASTGARTALFRRPWGLSRQFALAGGLIMLIVGALASLIVSHMASRAAIENTASSTALFLDSLVTPVLQPLAKGDILPGEEAALLDDLLSEGRLGERFPHLDIWTVEGLLAYSRAPELIGRRFALPAGAREALAGNVTARYADLSAREHKARGWTTRYLEIYVPVHEHDSGEIIAVAEIHEVTRPLEEELGALRLKSWGVVLGITLIVMAGLVGIVYRGSRIIETQQARLRRHFNEIKQVSQENRALSERLQHASERVTELSEANLRHISAELHDGPTQLLSFASLKIELIRRARGEAARERELQSVESALREAMGEIRSLCRGLMLPEIEHLTVDDIIGQVVARHEKRTGTTVRVRTAALPPCTVHAMKLCIYRFLQEGLNNAFQHADGVGQAVHAGVADGKFLLSVHDKGRRAAEALPPEPERGLGLRGLQDRVESLGGQFLVSHGRAGTRLMLRLPLALLAPQPRAGQEPALVERRKAARRRKVAAPELLMAGE